MTPSPRAALADRIDQSTAQTPDGRRRQDHREFHGWINVRDTRDFDLRVPNPGAKAAETGRPLVAEAEVRFAHDYWARGDEAAQWVAAPAKG